MVSNRLPFVLSQDENGSWTLLPGAGGLVSALEPVLRNRGGLWIGWPGTTHEVPIFASFCETPRADQGYGFRPVILSQQEFEDYYQGYANESIWPLFHDLQSLCAFKPEYWHAYREVNRRFAEVIADSASPNRFHLGPRLSVGVRWAGTPRTGCGEPAGLLPPHPLPSAGHLSQAARTARAPESPPGLRPSGLPDPA